MTGNDGVAEAAAQYRRARLRALLLPQLLMAVVFGGIVWGVIDTSNKWRTGITTANRDAAAWTAHFLNRADWTDPEVLELAGKLNGAENCTVIRKTASASEVLFTRGEADITSGDWMSFEHQPPPTAPGEEPVTMVAHVKPAVHELESKRTPLWRVLAVVAWLTLLVVMPIIGRRRLHPPTSLLGSFLVGRGTRSALACGFVWSLLIIPFFYTIAGIVLRSKVPDAFSQVRGRLVRDIRMSADHLTQRLDNAQALEAYFNGFPELKTSGMSLESKAGDTVLLRMGADDIGFRGFFTRLNSWESALGTIKLDEADLRRGPTLPLMIVLTLLVMSSCLVSQNYLRQIITLPATSGVPPRYALRWKGIVVRRTGLLLALEIWSGYLLALAALFLAVIVNFGNMVYVQEFLKVYVNWVLGAMLALAILPMLLQVLSEIQVWRFARRAMGIATGPDTAEIRLVLKCPASEIVRASVCRPGRLLPTLEPAEPLEEVQIEEDEGQAVVVISNFNSMREQSLTALPGAWNRNSMSLSRRALLVETKRGRFLVMFSDGAEARWYGDWPLD